MTGTKTEVKKTEARRGKTVAELKSKAAELLKQAEEMEEKQLIRLGKAARKFYEDGYKDVEAFKKEAAKVLQ